MEEYAQLISDLKSEDDEKKRKAAAKIGETGDERLIPILIETIEKTDNHWVRNAIANALRELDAEESIPVLIKLIKKVGEKHSGSLIYALQVMDCRPVVNEIAEFLCSENFEQRELSLQIIEDMEGCLESDKKEEAIEKIRRYRETGATPETKKYLDHALKILKEDL